MGSSDGIHRDRPPATTGTPLENADTAVIALHGRGATAEGILQLVRQLGVSDIAAIAPQATRNTWYPDRFTAPIDRNEPWLSAALDAVGEAMAMAGAADIPADRIVILGFSQGACLGAEFTARNPARYGGLIVFSGGLIGPAVSSSDYEGSLERTPIYLGCGDRDPHIPVERVRESAAIFDRLGADVTTQIFDGMGHTVNEEELEAARTIVESAKSSSDRP